jgi:hypothetical protein
MQKRLEEKTEQIRKLVSKPPTIWEEEEGEALETAAAKLARWASQISPSENPTISPFPKEPSLPPPPLLKAKQS